MKVEGLRISTSVPSIFTRATLPKNLLSTLKLPRQRSATASANQKPAL